MTYRDLWGSPFGMFSRLVRGQDMDVSGGVVSTLTIGAHSGIFFMVSVTVVLKYRRNNEGGQLSAFRVAHIHLWGGLMPRF